MSQLKYRQSEDNADRASRGVVAYLRLLARDIRTRMITTIITARPKSATLIGESPPVEGKTPIYPYQRRRVPLLALSILYNPGQPKEDLTAIASP